MMKQYWHRPNHLFVDNTPYFITGAIYRKRRLIAEPSLKIRLSELIRGYFEKYGWELHHWVVLDNHYHLLGKSRKGRDMSAIIRGIHSCSGSLIRETTRCELPIWWNYWDYSPRNEIEYMTRLNYLLNNPVRHAYVVNLTDYTFSSFHTLYKKKGRKELLRQFRKYPDYRELVLPEKEDDF